MWPGTEGGCGLALRVAVAWHWGGRGLALRVGGAWHAPQIQRHVICLCSVKGVSLLAGDGKDSIAMAVSCSTDGQTKLWSCSK